MKKRIFACLIAVALLTAPVSLICHAAAAGIFQHTTPISGSTNHTLAIKSDGSVWAWGSNKDYQLGLSGSVAEALTPTQIEGFSAISVAAGYSFSAALQQSGLIYVWGNGTTEYPRLVQGISGVAAIEAGDSEILALCEDGTVWQWFADAGKPEKVAGLDSIAAISAGGAHFHALAHSGEVWSWGSNSFGQLGIGSTTNQETPVKIDNLMNVISISAGFSHSLAVTEDGKVYAWGNNSYGELGDGTRNSSTKPIEVSRITNAAQVSAGNAFSIALTTGKTLYTWGYGEFGQLAQNNNKISAETPGVAVTINGPIFIGSGMSHAFYIDSMGALFIWGRNNNNQLGTNQAANEKEPRRINSGFNVSQEYSTSVFGGASQWAIKELSEFYEMDMAPRLLWSNYKAQITRSELAHLLVTLHEQVLRITVKPSNTSPFKDTTGHLLEASILKANYLDIINGMTPAQFNPDTSTTREQAAKMISVFVEKTKKTNMEFSYSGPLPYYNDADKIGNWAIPYVAYAHENGIMEGSNNRFDPIGKLTREQALVMMYRTLIQFGWAR